MPYSEQAMPSHLGLDQKKIMGKGKDTQDHPSASGSEDIQSTPPTIESPVLHTLLHGPLCDCTQMAVLRH